MKNRPTNLQQKCRPMSLASDGMKFMRIFGQVPWEGRQTTVVLSRTTIFSDFAGYFSETLEMMPALLYSDTQSIVCFSVIPKCVTLNDLERLFRVNSVVAQVWLAPTVRHSKNNCLKTNKDISYTSCQQRKSSAVTLLSANIRLLRIFARIL